MLKSLPSLFLALTSLCAFESIHTPITFNEQRVALTKAYIAEHYGIRTDSITIAPKIIVIHHTGIDDFDRSLKRLMNETLPSDRPDIAAAGRLNVSAHFMVEQDGTLHSLMDETVMARHVIGLNYSSIGIENVGGENLKKNLTDAQLESNAALITSLVARHPGITYLIGHHEYRCFEQSPLWLEKDNSYRTQKHDPGAAFMAKLRRRFPHLKPAPCDD